MTDARQGRATALDVLGLAAVIAVAVGLFWLTSKVIDVEKKLDPIISSPLVQGLSAMGR